MSTTMRAKMVVNSVQRNVQHDGQVGSETVFMNPVCKSRAYPPDGYDEDNTFAKFSPSGELRLV
ncbi:MAG TPA: hypothetical protein VK150_00510, partial [Geothrix sp.]|nr:hypothetical protein [Geothrix sp.]